MALLTCILRPETWFTANALETKSPAAITANVSPSRGTSWVSSRQRAHKAGTIPTMEYQVVSKLHVFLNSYTY